jgi:hypothetical protein
MSIRNRKETAGVAGDSAFRQIIVVGATTGYYSATGADRLLYPER